MTVKHGVNAVIDRLADAPNPADCPHHHCDYTRAGDAGLVLLVALVVLVVMIVLAIVGVHRVRARRHRAEADDTPEDDDTPEADPAALIGRLIRHLMEYLESLGLTLVIEVPIYVVALWALLEVRPRSGALAGIGVNLASHPLGFLVFQPALIGSLGYGGSLFVIELWAWLVEAALLVFWLRRGPWSLLGTSLAANGLSFGVGLLLFR